jgi:hypothetical protein
MVWLSILRCRPTASRRRRLRVQNPAPQPDVQRPLVNLRCRIPARGFAHQLHRGGRLRDSSIPRPRPRTSGTGDHVLQRRRQLVVLGQHPVPNYFKPPRDRGSSRSTASATVGVTSTLRTSRKLPRVDGRVARGAAGPRIGSAGVCLSGAAVQAHFKKCAPRPSARRLRADRRPRREVPRAHRHQRRADGQRVERENEA